MITSCMPYLKLPRYQSQHIYPHILQTPAYLPPISMQQFIISSVSRMKKELFLGVGVGSLLTLLAGFATTAIKQQQAKKEGSKRIYVGIELGGTNYSVAFGQALLSNEGKVLDFRIIKRKSGHTYQNPNQSIAEIISFIRELNDSLIIQGQPQPIYFIGVASFGPICLDKSSQLYGSITTTPKQLWRGINVLKSLTSGFEAVKSNIDTDVNAAAYAQFRLGQHKVSESLAYITVGTGVGVGVIANGKTVHGLTHPQGGHIIAERHPEQFEHFRGVCPYHKEQICIEAMVCNKSIAERLKVDFTALAQIPDESKVWKLVGFYLAQLCLNITLLLSPEVIVIGGGIMNRKILYKIIQKEFVRMLAGYVQHPLLGDTLEGYIVGPRLGSDVGVKGAMALALL